MKKRISILLLLSVPISLIGCSSPGMSAVSFDGVYAERYDKNSGVFISEEDDFYKNLEQSIVDAELEIAKDSKSIEKERAVWNEKIASASKKLKSSKDIGEKAEKLDAVLSAWDKYDDEIELVDYGLYGVNGVVPGSVYHDIVEDYAMTEYELFGGAVLSWEYEITGKNDLKLKNLSKGADLSGVNWQDFDDRSIVMEYDQDFQDMIKEYSLEDSEVVQIYDASKELCSQIDELTETKLGYEQCVDDYYELISQMADLEESISGEATAAQIKKKRISFMFLKLLNAKYLIEIVKGPLPSETETAQAGEDPFDAFLKGETYVDTLDGTSVALSELSYGYDVNYTFADIDKDGEDELFILAGPEAYVIEKVGGDLELIYDGCGYERPIVSEELTGVLYYRPGQAPLNEIYMFTEFSSDEKSEKFYASWYDDNANEQMDEDDIFFLDDEDEVGVSMEEWLAATQKYMDHKNDIVDWQTLAE